MARCPLCGNKVTFSWAALFSKTLDGRGRNVPSREGELHPDRMQFSCGQCKARLTLGVWDIVFFYIICGLPVSFFFISIPLLVFVFPIPIDKYVIAPVAWLVFLLVFSAAWVYFGIRFVWWEMLVMLHCDDAATQLSKARFYAAVMIIATIAFFCARMFIHMLNRYGVGILR